MACRARHCGHRDHLNDDLDVLTLAKDLIDAPPADLWPNVVPRLPMPADVETLLLRPLELARAQLGRSGQRLFGRGPT